MIYKRSKFGCTQLAISFESADAIGNLLKNSKANRISIYSYERLQLPNHYKELEPRRTPIIPVEDKTNDDLLRSYKKNVRNEINQTTRWPITSIEINGENRKKFISLYKDFEWAQGRRPIDVDLLNQLDCIGLVKNGKALAGILYYVTEKAIRVHSIFSLRLHTDSGTSSADVAKASKRVVHALCVEAGRKEKEFVDLAYINTGSEKRAGINSYKLGFNPTIIEEYGYVYKSPIYALFEKIYSLLLRTGNSWAKTRNK